MVAPLIVGIGGGAAGFAPAEEAATIIASAVAAFVYQKFCERAIEAYQRENCRNKSEFDLSCSISRAGVIVHCGVLATAVGVFAITTGIIANRHVFV